MMAAPSSAIVRFSGVRKSYDGRADVVSGLNLEIARGEFLTLLGPSGSGKTTTLMMLAGFEDPTAGEITLDGASLSKVPPHRRGMGVVFQNYALFPHLSVAQNLAFPLEMRKLAKSDIQPRIARALELVRLDGLADRRPAQLSGGQQQRVALARALISGPKLVLMDEPLGALDKQLRERMQLELKRIHETLGVTIVYVTHDQSEALTMSDRIAVFNEGRIQQLGKPDEIYNAPANAFVASFIGETNRFDGVITARGPGVCQVDLGNGVAVMAAAGDNFTIGQKVVLSLRPEKIELGGPPGSANRFDARIEDIIYLGDHRRLRLSLPGGIVFSLKTSDTRAFQRGQMVSAAWPASACITLPADAAAP